MKMPLHRVTVASMVLAVVFAWTGLAAADSREDVNLSRKVGTTTQLEVTNRNGAVRVIAGTAGTVEIHAVKTTRYGDRELDLITIEVSEVNGILRIETTYRRGEERQPSFIERMFGSSDGDWSWPRVSVAYTISVPRGMNVRMIETTNGSIELSGITCNGTLSSTNGGISVRESSGSFEVRTTNGGINVRDTVGSVSATTTNGHIKVVDGAKVTKARTTNGSIEVDLKGVESDMDVSTTNGSITIGLPKDPSVELDLKTTNGRVNIGGMMLRVDTLSKEAVRARAGNGGARLAVRTTNGNITLREYR